MKTPRTTEPFACWQSLRTLPVLQDDSPMFYRLNDPADRPRGKCYIAVKQAGRVYAHVSKLVKLSKSGFLAITHATRSAPGTGQVDDIHSLYHITHLPTGYYTFKDMKLRLAEKVLAFMDDPAWGNPQLYERRNPIEPLTSIIANTKAKFFKEKKK